MPIVPFQSLPGSARVWVFASEQPLSGARADTLLAAVDKFLSGWRAHGTPLHCARDWRDDRFLTIGVDVEQEHASGCSIDGLFRVLQELQREIGAQLVGGGRVFYRTDGNVETATREQFAVRAKSGQIAPSTTVFDPSITELSTWREHFEQPASTGWTARYFK